MLRRTIFSAFALGLCLAASAQTNVQKFTPGITPSGINYFLPKTTIRFVVTAQRTTFHPGQYAEYAERYFDIHDATLVAHDLWQMESVTAELYGVPDAAQCYTIALNPKTAAPLVTLTPDGLLIAVNDDVDFPTPPTASSVTPIALKKVDATDYLTPDILRASSRAKKAELTAQEIYDIRENRDLLAKGQADFNPTDGQQLQLMLQQLRESEEGLMSLFVGTTSAERHTFIFDYTPSGTVERMPLFRFSKHLGLVDNDDLSGEPYFLTLTDETSYPTEAATTGGKAKKELPDLRYRIPGRARIVLSDSEKTALELTAPIAQFGHVEHLGKELFDKKFTTVIKLNAVTGNIEKISIPTPLK